MGENEAKRTRTKKAAVFGVAAGVAGATAVAFVNDLNQLPDSIRGLHEKSVYAGTVIGPAVLQVANRVEEVCGVPAGRKPSIYSGHPYICSREDWPTPNFTPANTIAASGEFTLRPDPDGTEPLVNLLLLCRNCHALANIPNRFAVAVEIPSVAGAHSGTVLVSSAEHCFSCRKARGGSSDRYDGPDWTV